MPVISTSFFEVDEKPWPSRVWLENRTLFVLFTLLFVVQCLRSAIHLDEARYLTVAWEMHLGGDYIIPHLNGEIYTHKPPLFFWLINILWAVFGASEHVAMMVPFLATVGSTLAMRQLAMLLYPGDKNLGIISPFVFVGTTFVLAWSQVIMFDSLMVLWVTLSWLLLLQQRDNHSWGRWLLLGLALGAAGLTKGPVILVYVLPAAGLMAYSYNFSRTQIKQFILGMILSVMVGLIVSLSWVALAVNQEGWGILDPLLFKQTAGRMMNSFNHPRAWWYFVVLLPFYFFPWILFPKVWKGLVSSLRIRWTPQISLIVLWTLAVLFSFSLISCKQPHYLLPIIPLGSILIASFLTMDSQGGNARRAVTYVTLFSILVLMAGVIVGDNKLSENHQIKKISQILMSNPNSPVAYVHNHYHGEYGFMARRNQVEFIREEGDLPSWFKTHPKGIAVIFTREGLAGAYKVLYSDESTPKKKYVVQAKR